MYKIDRRGRGGPKSYTRTDPKIVYRIFFDGFHFKIRSYNVNFLRDHIFHETYCALVIKIKIEIFLSPGHDRVVTIKSRNFFYCESLVLSGFLY